MASAEASARTVEAAVSAAAAQLGLPVEQVEVEVLTEAVPSTFGYIGQPARVRVTARQQDTPGPTDSASAAQATSPPMEPVGVETPTPTAREPQGAEQAVPTTTEPDPAPTGVVRQQVQAPPTAGGPRGPAQDGASPEELAADTELAADFVEGLLDLLDLDGDITTWCDEATGHVDVDGPDLGRLVGREGETLAALQELTRLAVVRQTKRRSRIILDVGGFRSRRREELIAVARAAAKRVVEDGGPEELGPMTAHDRKIIHDVIAETPGARSESVGEEPNRRVVVWPS